MGDGDVGERSAASFDFAQDERPWVCCARIPFVLSEVEAHFRTTKNQHG